MNHFPPGGNGRRPSPQLPAFCRTRRPLTTTVSQKMLQQQLWVVLALQLSTLLLVLAAPLPPPVRTPSPSAGRPLAATQRTASGTVCRDRWLSGAIASGHGAQVNNVPSTVQP